MLSCVFEDSSFDERALPVILAVHSGTPSEDELEGAALIEYDPAPATLESTARWMSIRDDLTAEGFTPTEILRVFLRAVSLAYNMPGPTTEMLAWMFAEVSGTEVPREVCEHLIALGRAPVPPGARRWHLDQAGAIAAARLACDDDLDPGFDRLLVEAIVPLPVVRAALAALPMERREALVLSTMDRMNFAADMLGWLLDTRDLVDTPAVAAARTRLINQAPGSDGMQALIAEESRGTPRPLHPRPTPAARKALQYLRDKRAEERRAADLGPLAERAWERAIFVEAPELRSMAAWEAAGERRREQITDAVVTALGPEFSLIGLRSFGGSPVAVLSRQGVRFCLVPGGGVDVGLSPEEEAEIRHAADQREEWEEDYTLLDELDLMRPLTHVEVGPMVVAQAPSPPLPPHEVSDELERSPLRLPSEAEWEYLARGGLVHRLTYRGPGVPDSDEWFEATEALGVDSANMFGLYGFGFQPEPCTDVFRPSHDGLPADGIPRCGAGPRVVKGGAAYCYPWQGCGEWHLLLSAMRTPQTAWEHALAPRFVIAIRTA
ncbi:hypothetical protein ABZ297_06320 [Nonomuraea sp. NPDC005983]|uniref:hypothetical protein n=1 Tax=Nonomuraea sp. NPDC005983 TaxID=3155595 RepID=UPI00339F2737